MNRPFGAHQNSVGIHAHQFMTFPAGPSGLAPSPASPPDLSISRRRAGLPQALQGALERAPEAGLRVMSGGRLPVFWMVRYPSVRR